MNKKILIAGISIIFLLLLIPSVSATWCNNDYGKKAPIVINNTGGSAQTYYQVELNYTYDSDMNANFNDIRVYNESDCSLIPLWNESAVVSSWNRIWFNATSIPASSWCNDTYYLYYNYSSSSSVSNITNTFLLGDDFLSGERTNVTDSNFDSIEEDGTALNNGTSGAWDYHIRGELGNVIYDPDNPIGGDYIMVYNGYAGAYTTGQCKVGLAYSSDKKSWTKYLGNPVISNWIEDLYLVKNGSNYYLYGEDDGNTNIILYNSTNLVNWTSQGTVLAPSASGWDDLWVGSQVVWIEGSTWYMLYEGENGGGDPAIGLATSTNESNWTREATNPVFESANASWVSVTVAPDDIYKSGSTYYMLYHGYPGAGNYKSGIATSTDLISWTDSSNSPQVNSATSMLNGGIDYLIYAPIGADEDKKIYKAHPYYSATFDTNKFEKTHSVPTSITNGVLRIQPPDGTYHYYVRTKNTFAYPVILEERWKYMTGGTGWRAYSAADIDVDANGLWGVQNNIWDWVGAGSFSGASPATDTWYRATTKMQTSVFNVSINNGAIVGNKSGLSISSPQKVSIGGAGATADIRVDYAFLRKYASSEPTTQLGDEESPTAATYLPPDPINLQNTTGNFWVNYTWNADSGNITDGYNVTWNSSWYNTSNDYMNKSVGASNWANITVWAWNSSGTGTMSVGNISDQIKAAAAAADTSFTVTLPIGYTYAHFNLTGIVGGRAHDTSGNANDGTIYNGTQQTDGKYGDALKFDGSNDYIDCGNDTSLYITGDVTVEATVKATTWVTFTNIVSFSETGETSDTNSFYGLAVLNDGGDIIIGHEYDAGVNQYAFFDANLLVDTWYHLCAVRDSTSKTWKLYVNGSQFGSTYTYTNDANGGSSNFFRIGVNFGSGGCYFNGTIDEVRIHNRALNLTEIQDNYNNSVTRIGLVGEWTFDHGSSTQTNVTCAGQNSTTPFYNVTNTGNINLDVRMQLNTTITNVILKADTDNNTTGAKEVNTSLVTIYSGLTQSNSIDIWMWSDFNHTVEQVTNKTLSINVTQ